MPRMIELFAGSKTTAKQFFSQGYETFTVDIEEKYNPDLVMDIMNRSIMKYLPANPDVVWASPPCKVFSLAATQQHHFAPGGKPLTEAAKEGIKMVKRTLYIIEKLDPKFWFLENPWTGFLKQQDFMKKYPMQKVFYCNYGSPVAKPTAIWGEHPSYWRPKGTCSHIKHVSLWSDASLYPGLTYAQMSYHRAIVPAPLGLEIAKACAKSKNRAVLRLGDFDGW